MKTKLSTILLVGAMVSVPLHPGLSKLSGVYKGVSVQNVLREVGKTPERYGSIPTKLRLPNGKGKVKGTVYTAATVGASSDVAINGRVRKQVVRQGGKKTKLYGRWTWGIKKAGGPSDASGRFVMTVKHVKKGYKISPPAAVKLRGNGPSPFTYRAKLMLWDY